jgi:hypothetical protein
MRPTIDELDGLTRTRDGHHVSLYLPTHRKGAEIRQDPIRLRNLVRDVRRWLDDRGARPAEVESLVEPLESLVDDDSFWRHRDEGLALFSAPGFFRRYDLAEPCRELAVVSHRFHVKPLVPLFAGDGRFYVLALGLGQVRAFEATREGLREIEVEGMPRSLEEVTAFEDHEQHLQFHTKTSGSVVGGRRPAVFHGHGGGEDDAHSRELLFCQRVDAALRRRIGGTSAPLVVAALEQLASIYREASHLPNLVPEIVAGNPQDSSEESLHRRAWDVVRPAFDRPRVAAVETYRRLATTGDGRTAADIEHIVPAAWHGRVDTLFVTRDEPTWGSFDPESGEVVLHDEPGASSEDLLDLASVHTLAKGGTVYPVAASDVPADAPAAAILRF